MRIDYGPGYRIYWTERGDTVVLLLCSAATRPPARRHRQSARDDQGAITMPAQEQRSHQGQRHQKARHQVIPRGGRSPTTPEMIDGFLNEVIALGDPAAIPHALGTAA